MDPFARYQRNTEAFPREMVERIHTKSVCVVGCGGLGGHVISSLARFGLGALTIIDGDSFDESNLNRQSFCYEDNLGRSKAEETKKQLEKINAQLPVTALHLFLTEENAPQILAGHDLVVDCLDSIPTRLMVEHCCEELNIPLVHGAIAGFLGQVGTIFPGDRLLTKLYGASPQNKGVEAEMGNPPFIPQLVAAIQSKEALQFLGGRHQQLLRHQILYMDLSTNSFDLIEIP